MNHPWVGLRVGFYVFATSSRIVGTFVCQLLRALCVPLWPTFFRSRSRKTSVCAAARIIPQRTGSVRFVFAKFVRGATEVLPLQLRLATIPKLEEKTTTNNTSSIAIKENDFADLFVIRAIRQIRGCFFFIFLFAPWNRYGRRATICSQWFCSQLMVFQPIFTECLKPWQWLHVLWSPTFLFCRYSNAAIT